MIRPAAVYHFQGNQVAFQQPATGLWVQDLTKRYGTKLAVDRLTFGVSPGEILGVAGPNGAGKTTTLLSLAGLIRPDAGLICWEGRPLGPERARAMALIPETPEVYDMLTVWEHLVFVARSCRLKDGWRPTAEELLARLDIADQRDSLGEALSKGMRQKVLVAAAVLAGTPVLLLDEPMIGLDPRGQRELTTILRELRDQGRAVIVSTHLLGYIEGLCDRVLILKEGRALALGTVAELLDGADGKSLEDRFLEIVER
jgi:ABC-2 type transport system ATP-binding protein